MRITARRKELIIALIVSTIMLIVSIVYIVVPYLYKDKYISLEANVMSVTSELKRTDNGTEIHLFHFVNINYTIDGVRYETEFRILIPMRYHEGDIVKIKVKNDNHNEIRDPLTENLTYCCIVFLVMFVGFDIKALKQLKNERDKAETQ